MRPKKKPWIWLAPGIALVVALLAVLIVQHLPPPGTKIVGREAPEGHPEGPCFECHKGMTPGAQLADKPPPEGHPPDRCAECHEGYTPARDASPPEAAPQSEAAAP